MVRLAYWVSVALVGGCGPSAVELADCDVLGEGEVIAPDGASADLQALAVADAQARLEAYILPPQQGFAFRGAFELTQHGRTVGGTAAEGLFVTSDSDTWTFELCEPHDGGCLLLKYNFYGTGLITISNRPPCPPAVPAPEVGEPFVVPTTLCAAGDRGGADATFSVTVEPISAGELMFDDVVGLNDIPTRRHLTPNPDTIVREGGIATMVDFATYRDGPPDNSTLYIDYEATWRIDTDCLASFALARVDIVHVERCDFAVDHWHGRYDVPCTEIATLDGRPDWAATF